MPDVGVNFAQGRELDNTQKHILGYELTDRLGYTWEYTRFDKACKVGQVIRAGNNRDFMQTAADHINVAAAQAIGTDKITVAANTFNAGAKLDGCFGQIIGNASDAGRGQAFYVKKMINATTLQIVLLTQALAGGFVVDGTKGWKTALTTNSDFALFFPGAGYLGDGNDRSVIKGVSQVDVSSSDEGNVYGFILKRGIGFGLLDVSHDTGLSFGGPVASVSGGGIAGARAATISGTTTTLINNAINNVIGDQRRVIGRALVGDIGGTGVNDSLVLCEFAIDSIGYSKLVPARDNAFNQTTIKNR